MQLRVWHRADWPRGTDRLQTTTPLTTAESLAPATHEEGAPANGTKGRGRLRRGWGDISAGPEDAAATACHTCPVGFQTLLAPDVRLAGVPYSSGKRAPNAATW